MSGYIDRSKASFISVESSSGVDVALEGIPSSSRGFFRDIKASITEALGWNNPSHRTGADGVVVS